MLLGGDGVLFVGRVGLDGAGLELEMASVPGVLPQTALGARGDPSGTALLAVGGLRETHGALATPALAVVLSADAPLAAPVAIPGADRDAVPYPWIHDGTMEIVRFVRDDGVAGGRFHRYAIEGSTAVELGTFATAGALPPLAMASTRSTFVWAESSLAEIGAADLRVLAAPPRTCAAVTPASVAHLPTPLVDRDPRALVATEADGRTYVAFIEKVPVDYENAMLVVLDLGSCRDTT